MNYRDLVYFDIETAGQYVDLESLKSNDKRGYELFMRKIERKSSQYIDWKEDPNDVYINKAGLMPEFGRIVCVSIAMIKDLNGSDDLKIMSYYDDDEEVLINKVHKVFTTVSNKTLLGLCGYFIKGFDIPWLIRKMLKYGLAIPKVLKTFGVKPWEMNTVDLSKVWRGGGALENISFDEMLYMMDIKSPKSIMAGKDVHSMFWNSRKEDIRAYCEGDVMGCIGAGKKIVGLL